MLLKNDGSLHGYDLESVDCYLLNKDRYYLSTILTCHIKNTLT